MFPLGIVHPACALAIRFFRLFSVKLLLIADELLRKENEDERKSVENLMLKVEKMGGRIMIINTQIEAGKQLVGLGGLAALLRFSIA